MLFWQMPLSFCNVPFLDNLQKKGFNFSWWELIRNQSATAQYQNVCFMHEALGASSPGLQKTNQPTVTYELCTRQL